MSVTTREQERRAWHSLDRTSLATTLKTTTAGFTSAEAASRLAEYGRNQLPHRPPPAWWQIVLRQFRSPLIYILGLAAVVSLAINEPTDAAFIAAVLCLNAAIGGYQEWRAEQNAQALQNLMRIRASVLRNGDVSEIDAEEVVPGDVIWLESGNRVPADIRLLQAHGLEIDESLLTGESRAVVKVPSWSGEENVSLGDRLNMAYAGSTVTRGRAQGIAVSTGAATHVGQLALDVVSSRGGRPPLLERMERFTHVIAAVVLAAAVIVGCLGVFLRGQLISEMFLFAVALAVSAIPEGLPVAMTVALSIATSRMAKRGVIVRKLTAVEGLGSCTLVATDKTGTLTVNAMTVREVFLPAGKTFEITGEGFVPSGDVLLNGRSVEPGDHPQLEGLARAAVLCNEADLRHTNGSWAWRGDAVDVAFLSLGHKLGWIHEKALAAHPQVNQIPFESERQYAATYHNLGGQVRAFVKGAPERTLEMCGEPDRKAERLKQAELMAARGYRVLALAEGDAPAGLTSDHAPPEPTELRFLGFVGMIDPLRPGVRDAVEDCHESGVDVTMITGDHRVTALAIARELGMANSDEQVMSGQELLEKTPEELREIVGRIRVFARVSPRQKLEIVNAAREAGHFVAVTGDGVNDAPALRAANIGVAMGKGGTDVAREAAELVLSDDNFATIVAGIDEGRIAYDNIRKVIYLLVSTGAAELILVLLSVIAGTPLPLLPVQLLWLNLVTNGIQDVALAFEPGEGDTLRRKPRPPSERIFNRLMIERTLIGAVIIGVVGFAAFYWMLNNGWTETSARNGLLLLMVLFENVHIGNCRSETKSAFVMSPFRSPILITGTAAAFLIHVAAVYSPMGQKLLSTEPVSMLQWLTLLCLALTVLAGIEIHKWNWKRRTLQP
ncbi:MAG: HAD-IC family P-type ATPase [Rhodopirellula sp.]|nr:HAD-IC family P-type ATPase [Rhodopirellula sp.]